MLERGSIDPHVQEGAGAFWDCLQAITLVKMPARIVHTRQRTQSESLGTIVVWICTGLQDHHLATCRKDVAALAIAGSMWAHWHMFRWNTALQSHTRVSEPASSASVLVQGGSAAQATHSMPECMSLSLRDPPGMESVHRTRRWHPVVGTRPHRSCHTP